MATLNITGLKTSTTIHVQVRAITNTGTSDWSPTFDITTVGDTIAPNTPSTPTVVPYLGTLRIYWDGLDALGGVMPRDFNLIEIHSSTTNGFTPSPATLVGTAIGGGYWPHTGLTYGTTYYYRLLAVDRSGNKSAVASGQASGVPVQVVGPDIFDGAVGSAKLADLAVITAKIGDLSVNDAKIANIDGGKINAASIQTDKIAVGVLRTNLPSNASFEDTDVPNAQGVFSSLPGWVFVSNGGTRIGLQEVGPSFVPPVSGRGKVTLSCTGGSTGSSIISDAFPLNAGAVHNWSMLVAGYGRITARVQTSTDGVTWTDHVNSLGVEALDVIGTEQQTFKILSNVRVISTTNGTLATAFANGQTVDGVTLATGNRILLVGQTNQAENGFYTVNSSGAPTRSTDANTTGSIYSGVGAYSTAGTANGLKFYYCLDIGDTTSVVTNKALTSNVATITTSAAHGLTTGQQVTVAGVDVTFNGTWIVTGTTSTTFTYAVTAANVSSVASSGTVQGAWINGVTSIWTTIPYLHAPVRAVSQTNGTLASAFANGQVVDGVTLVTGDRIFLANQTNGIENGIYTVNSSGAPTRAADADTSGDLAVGHTVYVQAGIDSGGSYLIVLTSTSTPWVPGTDTVGLWPDSAWNKISGFYTAPGGISFGRLVITNSNTPADTTVYVDDVFIMLNGVNGTEITSAGIRLFDPQGSETVRLTGAPTGGTFVNITGFDTSTNSSRTLASISDQGVGTFKGISTDSLIVGGQDISTLVGSSGVIAWGQRTTSTTDQSAELGVMSLTATLQPGRLYRVFTDPFYQADSGTGGAYVGGAGYVQINLRQSAANAAVSLASGIIAHSGPAAPSGNAATVSIGRIIDTAALGITVPTSYTWLITQLGVGGSTTHFPLSSTFPLTMYVQDIGVSDSSIGDIGVDWSVTTTSKQTYTSIWTATWSSSYFSSGGRNTFFGDDCNQGYYDSTNGNQKSMIGFSGNATTGETSKTVTAALSGATVTSVQAYLYAYHWYYGAGGTAVIGIHGAVASSPPATWSGGPNHVQVPNWARGSAKYVDMPNATFAYSSWVSGAFRGFTLGPGPSTASTYYGKFYGASDGSGFAPRLRIVYVR